MIAFADAFKERAQEAVYTDADGKEKPYVKRTIVRADREFIQQHGLMLTKVRDLENLDELYQDLDMAPLLAAYNDFLEREYIEDTGSVTEREKEDRAIDGIKNMVAWLEGIERVDKGAMALEAEAERVASLLSTGTTYMFSEDDSMLLALVTPAVSLDQMDQTIEGAASLREVIRDLQEEIEGLEVRMAGMPVLMLDEMEVGFGDMESSASGFIALTIGRLNLFTLSFAIILIGLGIDFSIHLAAAFTTARSRGLDATESTREMFRKAGPGVVTGALTTSAAFLVLGLTGLDALVELGIVLGAGIVLTLLASITALPAMLVIHTRIAERIRGDKARQPKPVRLALPFLGSMGDVIRRHPWPVAILFLLLTGGAVWLASRAQFEADMMEIEPPDMQSVTLHRDIIDRFELHPDYSIFTTDDFEVTRKAVKRLKKNRLIGRVDAITEFLPSDKEQKKRKRRIEPIRERMRELLEPEVIVGLPGGPVLGDLPSYMTAETVPADQTKLLMGEIDRFQMNVQEIGQLAYQSMKNRLHKTCERITGGEDERFSRILTLNKRLAKREELARDMAAYQRAYVPRLAEKLERMGDTSPITLETLPDEIRDRYMSAEGRNLVTVYSSVDVWQFDKMDLFLAATRKVSERVTGSVVLVDRLIVMLGSAGLAATLLALGAVFVILLIDFRSFRYAIVGTIPLLAGFAWMLGSFVLLGWKSDVANVAAIPLILGIGIDDSVHMLHGLKREGLSGMSDVLRHTGRALVLTSLTTGIAFGSIAFASHVGLAGMGLLLVLGVGACLITSLGLLPALARIIFKKEESKTRTEEVSHAS
jgi:predicted RND superfamily exporter protein